MDDPIGLRGHSCPAKGASRCATGKLRTSPRCTSSPNGFNSTEDSTHRWMKDRGHVNQIATIPAMPWARSARSSRRCSRSRPNWPELAARRLQLCNRTGFRAAPAEARRGSRNERGLARGRHLRSVRTDRSLGPLSRFSSGLRARKVRRCKPWPQKQW
jgi:hypothetical protein